VVTAATTRVPQEERSRAMRARLLEATVELLVERGFAGTSTTLVSERAGVSRGAQLHHFPTKNDLVLAAVEHLSEVRGRELAEAARDLPTGRRRTRAVLDMLADHVTSPVFTAALELWVAARSHPDLRHQLIPAEQRVNAELAEICRAYVTAHPVQIRLTLDLLLGRGVSGLLTAHSDHRQGQVLAAWARLLRSGSDS